MHAPLINQDTLLKMLTTVRPHGSAGEQQFVDWLKNTLNALGATFEQDDFGNLIVNHLPDAPTQSRVMFTSHTDSVHHFALEGETPTHQKLAWTDDTHTTIGVDPNQDGDYIPNCLGADCATGVYIMLRLLQAKVPALYCFFRQEESGRHGSIYYANHTDNKALIDSITHCISFDRKSTCSIITAQKGTVCASDEFADWLGATTKAIDPTLTLAKDPTGSYTDSASFMQMIGECTNISVGYYNQHTPDETQDVVFVEQLCQAFAKIDWLNAPHWRIITAEIGNA